jgi:histone deacetylase complex regulatory component SIN3
MFRYISFLYERLEKAKQLAHNEEYPRNKPPHEEAANKEWNQAHPDENKMQVDGEEQPQVVIPEKGPFDDSAAEARYAKHFLEPLEVVLNTPQDPVAFEDEVRTHLGVEAYVLFTTERIIQFIVKQIQTVVADDELYDQLLGLYKYEFTRPAGFADSSYMNNARELLAEERRCYRFTYNQASGEFAITELNMTQTQQPTSALAQALADGATASTSTGGAAAASSPGASYVPPYVSLSIPRLTNAWRVNSRRVPDDAASIVNNLVNSSQAESDGSAAPFLKR